MRKHIRGEIMEADIWKFLSKYDRQIIFSIVLILSFIPAFRPLMLPLPQYELTNKAFNYIESLKPGDLVLVSFDFTPGVWVELGTAMKAVMQHLFIKKLKIVIIAFDINGPTLAEKVINEINLMGAEYGVDYVILGYIPGMETGMASFVANPRMIERDYYGNPTAEMEIMKKVKSISDFKLYIFACYTWIDPWMRQFSGKVSKIIGILSSDAIPQVMPYISSGQLYTAVRGMRGAAEYEQLLGMPGEATSYMDAVSLTLTFGVILIFFANSQYLRKKREGI